MVFTWPVILLLGIDKLSIDKFGSINVYDRTTSISKVPAGIMMANLLELS